MQQGAIDGRLRRPAVPRWFAATIPAGRSGTLVLGANGRKPGVITL